MYMCIHKLILSCRRIILKSFWFYPYRLDRGQDVDTPKSVYRPNWINTKRGNTNGGWLILIIPEVRTSFGNTNLKVFVTELEVFLGYLDFTTNKGKIGTSFTRNHFNSRKGLHSQSWSLTLSLKGDRLSLSWTREFFCGYYLATVLLGLFIIYPSGFNSTIPYFIGIYGVNKNLSSIETNSVCECIPL